jgi:hypothetical protein
MEHFVACLNDYRLDNKGILRMDGRQDNRQQDLRVGLDRVLIEWEQNGMRINFGPRNWKKWQDSRETSVSFCRRRITVEMFLY